MASLKTIEKIFHISIDHLCYCNEQTPPRQSVHTDKFHRTAASDAGGLWRPSLPDLIYVSGQDQPQAMYVLQGTSNNPSVQPATVALPQPKLADAGALTFIPTENSLEQDCLPQPQHCTTPHCFCRAACDGALPTNPLPILQASCMQRKETNADRKQLWYTGGKREFSQHIQSEGTQLCLRQHPPAVPGRALRHRPSQTTEGNLPPPHKIISSPTLACFQ